MGKPCSKHAVYAVKKKFGDLQNNKRDQTALNFFADSEALLAKLCRYGKNDDELDKAAVKHNLLTAIEVS